MKLFLSSYAVRLAAVVLLPPLAWSAPMTSNNSFCALKPSIIKNSQRLEGAEFIGGPVEANQLHPKLDSQPRSATVHYDGANTGSLDYPGPLGRNLSVTSVDTQYGVFYWDSKGLLFASYGGPCDGSATTTTQALVIVDPQTLEAQAAWQLPDEYADTTLNLAYMQLLRDTDEVVVSSVQGQIYILQKQEDASGSPSIELRRLIDLSSDVVLKGQTLLNTMMDTSGNVWFTTGAVDGIGDVLPTNTTIVGYIEENDTIHSLEIPNQTVGNGISVSNNTVFVNTEPSALDDRAYAVGFIAALEPGPGTTINMVWNATYQAGSGRKPGALGRGSGTTPSLLGDDFLAIADNHDDQINLLIYSQHASGQDVEPICTLPLFQRYRSWTDNGPMVHYDGKDYSVVMMNMNHQAAFEYTHKDINGAYNNFTTMSPGISKFFVAGDGSGCHAEWTNPSRMTTVPVLSTATGLIYGYEQSQELANQGEYVWYASAIDYESGKTVWKARTGAGGIFNNYLRTTFLGPDGTMYQMVQGGVVIIKDGE